ncbi:ABC transporter G family member 23 [Orchesella cincta]|uniref:ABC transporter G family member 23 n=1 Tax=Orchesella cincta TaxID=48709 RepID=A0A1D2MG33_ORCCI|nr:ABC transporter G family member 23 [Orchesella cincta]
MFILDKNPDKTQSMLIRATFPLQIAIYYYQNASRWRSGGQHVASIQLNWKEIPVESAVFVRDLCKSYGDGPPILRSVCMNVKKGSVYGLLGASGCGKTSLLSCIVGVHNWDSGEVIVFGNQLSSKRGKTLERKCGYMPQDVSLYGSLTFYEMAFFFGKLYNMSKPNVKCQVKFLAQLLQMTFTDKIIAEVNSDVFPWL